MPGICVGNASSLDTMVSKLKLDHNEVLRAFVQKYRRSVFFQSLFEHTQATDYM